MEEKKLTDELEGMYVSGKFNGEIIFNAIKTIYALQEENAEQKAEIETLKTELCKECEEHEEFTKKAKAEIERLEKDVHDMSWIIKIHKYCVGADHCQNSSMKEFKLQKQVDELKEENKELYKENTTLIAGSILERKDIAKDTAKEILAMFNDRNYITENELKKAIAERYGVSYEENN